MVYGTPSEAINSLSDDEREEHIRLILVAGTRQLRAMLEPGREVCHHQAALYLRVSETCPLYYLAWERGSAETSEMSIVSRVPQRGKRKAMFDSLKNINSERYAVVGLVSSTFQKRTRRNRRLATEGSLRINPGDCVVGGPGFAGEQVEEELEGDGETEIDDGNGNASGDSDA